jgi:hypothetical protein
MKQLWVTRLPAAGGLAQQRALSQGALVAEGAIERRCDDTQIFGNETSEWWQIELKSR